MAQRIRCSTVNDLWQHNIYSAIYIYMWQIWQTNKKQITKNLPFDIFKRSHCFLQLIVLGTLLLYNWYVHKNTCFFSDTQMSTYVWRKVTTVKPWFYRFEGTTNQPHKMYTSSRKNSINADMLTTYHLISSVIKT